VRDLLISADSHVWEPADLWTTRLPKQLRDRALRYEYHGDYMTAWWPLGFDAPRQTSSRFQDRDGNYVEDSADLLDRRFKHLEDDGVWGEVINPTVANVVLVADHELALAHARVYNDYVHELFSPYFDRHKPLGLIPLTDIDDAVAEVERVAAMGMRGIQVPATPPRPYHTRDYDRVWAAAQDHEMVVTTHIGSGYPSAQLAILAGSSDGVTPGRAADEAPAMLQAMLEDQVDPTPVSRFKTGLFGFAGSPAELIMDLVGSGVLERFPSLHFMFIEWGAYYLAGLVAGMDKVFTLGVGQDPEFETGIWDFDRSPGDQPGMIKLFEMNDSWPYPLRPSEYVRRQVHTTFMDDPWAIACREVTGVEALLWGNDYAHAEGTWPRSREAIERQFAAVDAEDRAAILGGTVAGLFDFRVPAATLA